MVKSSYLQRYAVHVMPIAMHQNAGDVGFHQNLIRRFCSIVTTVIHICMYILNVLMSVQIDCDSIVKQCTSMNSNTPSDEIYR